MIPSIRLPWDWSLEDAYQGWWEPTYRPPFREQAPWLPRARPPKCHRWYDMPAPIPHTAQWALVYATHRPLRVIYYKTRQAALSKLEELPFADHPHVRLISVAALKEENKHGH